MGAYIALMRPKNLVLAGATVPLGAYFALMDTSEAFPFVAVTLHTLAVMLFTGAGNAMNDIKDAEIDKTAHPMRPYRRVNSRFRRPVDSRRCSGSSASLLTSAG